MKIKFALLVMSLLLAMPFAFAQELALPAPGMAPDSPIWGLDLALEKLQLALTTNQLTKVELRLKFARERLAEAKLMAEQNKFAEAEEAELEREEEIDDLEAELEEEENILLSDVPSNVLDAAVKSLPTGITIADFREAELEDGVYKLKFRTAAKEEFRVKLDSTGAIIETRQKIPDDEIDEERKAEVVAEIEKHLAVLEEIRLKLEAKGAPTQGIENAIERHKQNMDRFESDLKQEMSERDADEFEAMLESERSENGGSGDSGKSENSGSDSSGNGGSGGSNGGSSGSGNGGSGSGGSSGSGGGD